MHHKARQDFVDGAGGGSTTINHLPAVLRYLVVLVHQVVDPAVSVLQGVVALRVGGNEARKPRWEGLEEFSEFVTNSGPLRKPVLDQICNDT